MSGETMRTPVTTLAELDTLDDDEILALKKVIEKCQAECRKAQHEGA